MGRLKELDTEIKDLIDKQTEGLINLNKRPEGVANESIRGLASLLKCAISQTLDKHLVMLYDSEKELPKQLENQDDRVLPET